MTFFWLLDARDSSVFLAPVTASTPRETDNSERAPSLARDERDREHGMLGGALG